jgi:hypothetical protein
MMGEPEPELIAQPRARSPQPTPKPNPFVLRSGLSSQCSSEPDEHAANGDLAAGQIVVLILQEHVTVESPVRVVFDFVYFADR